MSTQTAPRRKRGALLSPRHRLAAARPHQAQTPTNVILPISPLNSMFGNDTCGNCVSAEECVNINNYAFAQTGKAVLISTDEIEQWCADIGVLDGADNATVLDALQPARKMPLTTATADYYDGEPLTVDWTNRAALCSAIDAAAGGGIKITVDADGLESVVGSANGWYLASDSGRIYDHDVCLLRYGAASDLAKALGCLIPAGLAPTMFCYLVDTWSTIGFVASATVESGWIAEAWLRQPSSIAVAIGPTPPPPPPTPTPPPPTPIPCYVWAGVVARALRRTADELVRLFPLFLASALLLSVAGNTKADTPPCPCQPGMCPRVATTPVPTIPPLPILRIEPGQAGQGVRCRLRTGSGPIRNLVRWVRSRR